MKTVLLFILLLPLVSFKKSLPSTYVFWGDSIMAGNELNHSGSDGPNNIYLRWTKQYAETVKSGSEVNNAQSGATLCADWGGNGPFETRLSQVEGYSAAVHSFLFIGYGFNDFSRALGPPHNLSLSQFISTFTSKLASDIQYIKTTKGWPGNKIVIVWNYIVDNPPYNVTQANWETTLAAVRNVVASEAVCILDFHTFWKNRSDRAGYTDGDLIHPNENANAIMAANVDALIEYPTGGGGNNPPPGLIRVTGRKFVVH